MAGALMLCVAACSGVLATYQDMTVNYGGKTYVLSRFSGTVINVTLFELVDGERQYKGFIEGGQNNFLRFEDLRKEEIPAGDESIRTQILTVLQQGEQQGEIVERKQTTLVPAQAGGTNQLEPVEIEGD